MAKIHKYEKRIGVFGGLDQTPYCTIQGGALVAGGIAAGRRGVSFLRQCSRMTVFPMQWGGLPLPGRALLFDVEK